MISTTVTPSRPIGLSTFTDLVGVDALAVIPDGDGATWTLTWALDEWPTATTEAEVRLRAETSTDAEAAVRRQAAAALATNAAYRAKGTATTAAEDKVQLRALTDQVSAIIRYLGRTTT